MLAVNHLNSQIKLTELWKAVNNADHPFKISKISDDSNRNITRASANGTLKITAHSKVNQKTFMNDGTFRCPKKVKDLVTCL